MAEELCLQVHRDEEHIRLSPEACCRHVILLSDPAPEDLITAAADIDPSTTLANAVSRDQRTIGCTGVLPSLRRAGSDNVPGVILRFKGPG